MAVEKHVCNREKGERRGEIFIAQSGKRPHELLREKERKLDTKKSQPAPRADVGAERQDTFLNMSAVMRKKKDPKRLGGKRIFLRSQPDVQRA